MGVPAPAGGAAAASGAEALLNRLVTGADGQPLTLAQLCGRHVPGDVQLYFCVRTFTALQVRVESRSAAAHTYGLRPEDISGQGGVYKLACERSPHRLQVKVQPSLGLRDLLPGACDEAAGPAGPDRPTIGALMGLCWALARLVEEPHSERVALSSPSGEVPKHLRDLVADRALLQAFLDRCPVFSCSGEPTPGWLKLAEHTKQKSRGLLLKSLFEVKMMIIIALNRLKRRRSELSQERRQELEALELDAVGFCCVGGLNAQYRQYQESMDSLRSLICGLGVEPSQEESSWSDLRACVENQKKVYNNLELRGGLAGLRLCTTDIKTDAAALEFLNLHWAIWHRGTEEYLFETACNQPGGPLRGVSLLRLQCKRADAPLQLLFPGRTLDNAIEEKRGALEDFFRRVAAKRGYDVPPDLPPAKPSQRREGANPRGAVGLDNPGENLCATNSLAQVLFSAGGFREAVLADTTFAEQGLGAALGGRQLVARLRALFAQMSEPGRKSASVRDVAAVLYGGELGEQQDSDELLHRVSALLQGDLGGAPGAVGDLFGRLFSGRTYEVHARCAAPGGDAAPAFEPLARTADGASVVGYPLSEDCSDRQFLCIPVQRGNRTLAQALRDFTGWTRTGGKELLWTRERFRVLPPFLCFAVREVTQLNWEECLSLAPFTAQLTPEALLAGLELAMASQPPGGPSGADATSNGRASSDPACSSDATVKEVPIAELLRGALDDEKLETVVCGLLGADTAQKLADLVFDGGMDTPNDTLEQLVQGGHLTSEDVEGIHQKLCSWRQEQHTYVAHALIIYQGFGGFGHYVSFARQEDASWLCFDDQFVNEFSSTAAVQEAIAEKATGAFPASVRMVVYRRLGAPGAAREAPLQLPGGPRVGPAAGAGRGEASAEPEGDDAAKRRRLE